MNPQVVRNEWLFKLIAYVTQNYPVEHVQSVVHAEALKHGYSMEECDSAIAFFLQQAGHALPQSSQPVIALPPSSQPVLQTNGQVAIAPTLQQPTQQTSYPEAQPAPTSEPRSNTDESESEESRRWNDPDPIRRMGFRIEIVSKNSKPAIDVEFLGYQNCPRFFKLQFRILRGKDGEFVDVSKFLAKEPNFIHYASLRKGSVIENEPDYIEIQVPKEASEWQPYFFNQYVLPRTNISPADPFLLATGLNEDSKMDCIEFDTMLIVAERGGGKSTLQKNLICCGMLWYPPSLLQFVLIDLKKVCFNKFKDIPHLWNGYAVSHDLESALDLLDKLIAEQSRRYDLFASLGIESIEEYNGLYVKNIVNDYKLSGYPKQPMPRILAMIDEAAMLVEAGGGELEVSALIAPLLAQIPDVIRKKIAELFTPLISRILEASKKKLTAADLVHAKWTILAEQGRQAGIGLVLGTQKPDPKIIPPRVRANLVVRVCMKVSAIENSIQALGTKCEKAVHLAGKGDFLMKVGGKIQRLQAFCLDDKKHGHDGITRRIVEIAIQAYGKRQPPVMDLEDIVIPDIGTSTGDSEANDYALYRELEALRLKEGSDRKALIAKYGTASGKGYELLKMLRAKYGG